MPEYLTDAHSLLWYLYQPSRLGLAAQAAFTEADAGSARIHVPAPALAEVLMAVEKGRIPGASLPSLLIHLESIRTSDNYHLSPLLPEVVLNSHVLTVIPDIFDRLIVAEAIARSLPLLTIDGLLRDSGLVQVVWD